MELPKTDWSLPSQPSGTLAFIRSSIENLTSTPFSTRESGSAFISQYCFPSSLSTASQPDSLPVNPSSSSSIPAFGAAAFSSAFVVLGLPLGLSALFPVPTVVVALVVLLLGLPFGSGMGATAGFGDRGAFFTGCVAVSTWLWDVALADFLVLLTGLLGDVPGVSGACCSSVGAVASFCGLPRPLAAVVSWAFVADLLASGLALFAAVVLFAVALCVVSPMLDRFRRPEA